MSPFKGTASYFTDLPTSPVGAKAYARGTLGKSGNFMADDVLFTPEGYEVFGEYFKEALKAEPE